MEVDGEACSGGDGPFYLNIAQLNQGYVLVGILRTQRLEEAPSNNTPILAIRRQLSHVLGSTYSAANLLMREGRDGSMIPIPFTRRSRP